MHKYIQQHWLSYFPKLPAYQTFVNRINRMADLFPHLVNCLIADLGVSETDTAPLLADSMPIITCSGKREPKVALDLVGKSFCASKNLYYHGLKLHLLAQKRTASLPLPASVGFTSASPHDLTCLRPVLDSMENKIIFADKACCDKPLHTHLLKEQHIELITPIKIEKDTPEVIGQREKAYNDAFSRAVSSVREPIESFFSWLQEKTQIQFASKVRSSTGLAVHIFGKLAAALCILMNFNP